MPSDDERYDYFSQVSLSEDDEDSLDSGTVEKTAPSVAQSCATPL